MPSLNTNAPRGFFAAVVTRLVEYADGSTRDASGDYFATEHRTGVKWIDGKPIFRTVAQLAGGNNTSSATLGALAGVIDVLNNARWACDDGPGTFRFMRGGNSGVDLVQASGLVTVQHQTFDFTGETVGVILEYTKL